MKKILTSLSAFALVFLFFIGAEASETSVRLFENYYTYVSALGSEGVTVTSKAVESTEIYENGEYSYIDGTGYECCGVTADKAGVYAVTWDNNIFGPVGLTDSVKNGEAAGYRTSETILDEQDNNAGVFFEMSEGEHQYVMFDEWEKGKTADVKFEYLGTMTDVEPSSELIRDGGECIYDGSNCWELRPHLKVSFSGGKTYTIMKYIEATASENSKKITADVTVLNKDYSLTFDIVSADKYVSDVSLPDDFTPGCTVAYNGFIDNEIMPEYLTVTMSDGSVKNVGTDEKLTIDNKGAYFPFAEYTLNDEGNIIMVYGISGLIVRETGEITPSTLPFSETVKSFISDSTYYVKTGFNIMLNYRHMEDTTFSDGLTMTFYPAKLFGRVVRYITTGYSGEYDFS